ncbi:MAG: hypothetical protein JXR86_11750 [Spirochaetales bacterium]|nr:hypothetical protein [Spirochaetales bacterium]
MKEKLKKKMIYLVYLFMGVGLVVGTLNNLYKTELIHRVYVLYENVFRTVIAITASSISLKLIRRKPSRPNMRTNSLLILPTSMILFLVILPALTGIPELYIAFMPFPWTTMPLQLLKDGYFFSTAMEPYLINGLIAAYVIYQAVILLSTVLYGRRVQCSMLCIFSGAHAETFSEVLPLVKSHKRRNRKVVSPIFWKAFIFYWHCL